MVKSESCPTKSDRERGRGPIARSKRDGASTPAPTEPQVTQGFAVEPRAGAFDWRQLHLQKHQVVQSRGHSGFPPASDNAP